MIIDKPASIDGHVNCAQKHIRRRPHRSMKYNQFCNGHHQYDSAESAVSRTDIPFSQRDSLLTKNISRLHRMYEDQLGSNALNTCCLPSRMSSVVSGTRTWASLAHRLVRQVAVKVTTRTTTPSRIVDMRAIITTAK